MTCTATASHVLYGWIEACIHCVQEKRERNVFFCNIVYKTWAILMKFGTPSPQ